LKSRRTFRPAKTFYYEPNASDRQSVFCDPVLNSYADQRLVPPERGAYSTHRPRGVKQLFSAIANTPRQRSVTLAKRRLPT
ncbi:MAG: hypothetical protein AB2807_04000, partial [Candidatus Sedimenticola endophacoides]